MTPRRKSLLDVTGIILKYIGYNVVTAKGHGGAMKHDRQAKETDKPCLLEELKSSLGKILAGKGNEKNVRRIYG
jgi:hypothetical protein